MKNWKKHLIGTVKLPIKKGSPSINEDELQKSLEWERAVCRCVCKKCGQISEIDQIYAQGLLRTMAILEALPNITLKKGEDFKNYYFEISYCEYCGLGELSIKLKEIKRS